MCVWSRGCYCEVIVSHDSLEKKKRHFSCNLESRLGNCLKKLDWNVDNEYCTIHVCTCTCDSAVVRLKEGTVSQGWWWPVEQQTRH